MAFGRCEASIPEAARRGSCLPGESEGRPAAATVPQAAGGGRSRAGCVPRPPAAPVPAAAARRGHLHQGALLLRHFVCNLHHSYNKLTLPLLQGESAANAGAVCLQAHWIASRQRAAFGAQRGAAVTLQAAIRCATARRRFLQVPPCSLHSEPSHNHLEILTGTLYPFCLSSQLSRPSLERLPGQRVRRRTTCGGLWCLQVRAAAVALQAGARGAAVRRELRRRHCAATVMQSAWRRHAAEARLHLARRSALMIQVPQRTSLG